MYLVDKLTSNLRFDEPRLQGGGGGGGWAERGAEGRRSLRAPRRDPPSREESWGSASDRDASSDDENDKSIGFRTNGNLRNTLNKARTLCDRWRSGGGAPSGGGAAAAPPAADCASLPGDLSPGGRLSRWFSVRRGSGHQYDVATEPSPAKMPQLPEVDEDTVCGSGLTGLAGLTALGRWERRQAPPALPPPPPGLSPQQLKRRHIVAAIVHSENSYVATLQRLVNDYKKPLEESSPAILSASKIYTLFHRLPDILQCHTLFRIALADSVRAWDRDEKLGDVFVASFSKAIVLDIYSGFINNFSVAMDLAKMEAKRKSALADFFKVKQISAHDRLSFFGLMVKPVQRFPQFILFLQDLLKHTPQGHHDRMSLQLALTQLESLAEMLNERKREAEQTQAFREMLRHVSGKFSSARPLTDGNRHLLREDNVTHLEFNQAGMITKSKSRRLLLLNDLVVCVSVAPRQSEEFGASERLSLKWMHPVADLEIVDSSASPTLSRILSAGLHRGGSLKSTGSGEGNSSGGVIGADSLCGEMSALMHDYEVVSRIADLAGTLRGQYNELGQDVTKRILQQIQASIQRKDEEMAWVDSCCLQIVAKNKSGKEETYTFQTESPSVKKDWVTELRLAQLALDSSNSPAWEVLEQEQRPSTKMPLFVKAQPVYKSQHQTEVRCGCYYSVSPPTGHLVGAMGAAARARRRKGPRGYLWVCTTDGASSHIAVLAQHNQHAAQLRDVGAFDLVETQVTAMEFVKGVSEDTLATSDSVWLGTDTRKIFLYAATEPEKQDQISQTTVPAVITEIKYHCDCVFVALGNGNILLFQRDMSGAWSLKDPVTINLGTDPVSCLLPINMSVYAACGKKVWVVNGLTGDIQKSFSVQHDHVGNVNLMAHSGVGLWISLKNSSTICLYHTETFKHLQDINLASNVLRVMGNCNGRDCASRGGRTSVTVSALLACRGLLWVGTTAGISLTIPLPRLEGVPIISGRVNISYHSHFGPITFLLALQPKTYNVNPYYSSQPPKDVPSIMPKETEVKDIELTPEKVSNDAEKATDSAEKKENEKQKLEKQLSDNTMQTISAKIKHQLTSSPVVLRRRRSKDNEMSRLSKTLPRSLGTAGPFCSTTSSQGSGDACDVYGLYGDLMYVKDCEGEPGTLGEPAYESLRRSDPELAAIPAKVSTLDRKLRMKVSRPRSLDLSNWSVDSRSSSLYTSSGSEESMALRGGIGRSISRNNSNASRTIQLNNGTSDVVNITVNVNNVSSTLNSSFTNGNALSVTPNSRSISRSNSVAQDVTEKGNKNKKGLNGKGNALNDSTKKTIITLMGGRGYVNWRSCCTSEKPRGSVPTTTSKEPNKNDAHIVVWETKS